MPDEGLSKAVGRSKTEQVWGRWDFRIGIKGSKPCEMEKEVGKPISMKKRRYGIPF